MSSVTVFFGDNHSWLRKEELNWQMKQLVQLKQKRQTWHITQRTRHRTAATHDTTSFPFLTLGPQKRPNYPGIKAKAAQIITKALRFPLYTIAWLSNVEGIYSGQNHPKVVRWLLCHVTVNHWFSTTFLKQWLSLWISESKYHCAICPCP